MARKPKASAAGAAGVAAGGAAEDRAPRQPPATAAELRELARRADEAAAAVDYVAAADALGLAFSYSAGAHAVQGRGVRGTSTVAAREAVRNWANAARRKALRIETGKGERGAA